jgi:hypothetical protein
MAATGDRDVDVVTGSLREPHVGPEPDGADNRPAKIKPLQSSAGRALSGSNRTGR